MKKITTSLILILLITCLFSATAFAAPISLTFESQEIYEALKISSEAFRETEYGPNISLGAGAFDDATRTITINDQITIDAIKAVNIDGNRIVNTLSNLSFNDLSQFNKFPNLNYLRISDSSIKDISAFSGIGSASNTMFPNLTSLDLKNNAIEDISALGNLIDSSNPKALTFLAIRNNNISNFANIKELNKAGSGAYASPDMAWQKITFKTNKTTGIVLPSYVSEALISGTYFGGPTGLSATPVNCKSNDGYITLDLLNVGMPGVEHKITLAGSSQNTLDDSVITIVYDPNMPDPSGSSSGGSYLATVQAAQSTERNIFYSAARTTSNQNYYTFVSNGPFAKFEGVWIHGFAISPSNYTASVGADGSTVVTLKQSFVNSISDSKDILLHLVFNDGYGVTKFDK